MELLDILAQAQGGQAVQQVAKQFGLSEEQSALAFEMLAPVIASGVRRNVRQEGGYDALINAVSGGRHERYFDDPEAIQFGNVAADGNNILGHIFGSKDVSRGVAQQLSGSSGIGSAILKQLLPVIASMVLGSLTKRMGTGSGGGLPFPLPEQRAPQRQPRQAPRGGGAGGGLGDILKDILGGSLGGGARAPQRQPQYRQEEPDVSFDDSIFRRDPRQGRERLEDILGRGSPGGDVADDLLNSVEQATRGRY